MRSSLTKRILAVTISLSMAFSIPISSYAEDGLANEGAFLNAQVDVPATTNAGNIDYRPDVAVNPRDAADSIRPTRELDADEQANDSAAIATTTGGKVESQEGGHSAKAASNPQATDETALQEDDGGLSSSTELELSPETTEPLAPEGEADAQDELLADEDQPSPGLEVQGKAVKDYSYSVTPILAPFNNLVYVRTDNPDPNSFCLTDKASKYLGKGETATFVPAEWNFYDVKYENASTRRVKGGYIFYDKQCDSDGGTLYVQEKVSEDTFKDTNPAKAISCVSLKDSYDYLIDTYAKGKTTFFDKLDAVQSGLTAISLYPRGLMDTSKPNPQLPYPFLATSPYRELYLNDHVGETYQKCDEYLFLSTLHPYVLDSLGFPSVMYDIAKRLGYTGEYTQGSSHWEVTISSGGTTKTYGGAGRGNPGSFYSRDVSKWFTFDGTASDLGTHATLNTVEQRYLDLNNKADQYTADMLDQVQGQAFAKSIGAGSWIRVQSEGFGYSQVYAYVAAGPGGGVSIQSDAWVDGHYINAWERIEQGATFAQHPHASIVKRNMSYTDTNGVRHKNDVVFRYDDETNTWRASYYYNDAWWFSSDMTLPNEFILTEDQVRALKPDANTNRLPTSGLIYDGTQKPGTPFSGSAATGVSLPATTARVGDTFGVTAQFSPSDAANKTGKWSCSDESVVGFVEGLYSQTATMRANKQGTATLTFVADDGGFKASCKVTVKPWFPDVYEWHWANGVIRTAVSRGLMNGYKNGNFGPNDNVTRGQVAVMLWNMAGKPTPGGSAKNFPDVTNPKAFYYQAIRWASSTGVVNGYGNGKFGPNDKVTREQFAVMLANYARNVTKQRVTGAESDYSSMSDRSRVSKWAVSSLGWCFKNKILTGTKDGRINPQGNATRAEGCKMLVGLDNLIG